MRFKKRLQHFFKDMHDMLLAPRFAWSTLISFIFCVFSFGLPILRIVPLRDVLPFIPLHYNIYLGVDRFGSWDQIFILPAVGFCLFLFNLFIQTLAFRREKLLAFMISLATAFLEFIFLGAMVLIVLLNLSYAS